MNSTLGFLVIVIFSLGVWAFITVLEERRAQGLINKWASENSYKIICVEHDADPYSDEFSKARGQKTFRVTIEDPENRERIA